ncbi:Uncharacterised protein [Mycobacteroides abscessus subsp. abscessus]|nr:Uncharacterised protein [Mycobacteroides abscessus subsp. abscessus]
MQRVTGAVRADQFLALQPPIRLRPFEIGTGAAPVRALPDDRLAAARATGGVHRPAAARGHPHHIRVVVGDRGHQHVVAVGDDDGVGMLGQPGAQPALDHVDLADPVELVAAEIEQHHRRRLERVADVRQVQFVHLDRGQRHTGVPAECRDDARVHVGAVGLGGDRAERAERGRGHPGGGRFAVGSGDQHGPPPAAELRHDRRVDLQRDQAADHRTVAAARAPRRPRRGRRGPQGDPPAYRKVRHAGECMCDRRIGRAAGARSCGRLRTGRACARSWPGCSTPPARPASRSPRSAPL